MINSYIKSESGILIINSYTEVYLEFTHQFFGQSKYLILTYIGFP
jgi:hypothetical protein